MKNIKYLIKAIFKYIFRIFFIFIILFSLTNCSHDALSIYKEIELMIPNTLEKDEKIYIPLEYNGAKISWEVDKPKYFDSYGNVIKTEYFDQDIIITVSVEKGKDIYTSSKKIILYKDIDQYFQAIEQYVRDSIRIRTHTNLRLVNNYYQDEDVSITYQSSKPNIIGHDGKYYPHEYDEDVKITCKVNVRNHKYTFTIDVTAIGISDNEKVVKVKEWLENYLETTTFVDDMELPTTHPNYGGTIKWLAEDPFIIINNKNLFLPKTAKEYLLMAEITFPASQLEFKKRVYLNEGPALSDIDYAIRFIKTSITKDFKQFIVLYDGQEPTINKNLIGLDAKNYTFYPSKKAPPQLFLDTEFYEGYQLPNDINLIWIVVHETGNRNLGKDAKVHSDLQYKRAYFDDEPDAYTSWHYSVDDHSIYQSFDDAYQCWNAGDGDEYSIGIEMCVNADGKYEASFLNNAKLIANLLLKYNLNIDNIRQHHDFSSKMCPETILKDRRWFEFLDLVAKEYISMSLLSSLKINYQIDGNLFKAWQLPSLYYLNETNEESTVITVEIEGRKFTIDL